MGVPMLMETTPSKYEVQRESYSAGGFEGVLRGLTPNLENPETLNLESPSLPHLPVRGIDGVKDSNALELAN